MEYLSLLQSLPKRWIQSLQKCNYTSLVESIDVILNKINKLDSHNVYWKLLGKIVKSPTLVDYWISEFPFLHDKDFSEIYKIQKSVTEVRPLPAWLSQSKASI